MALKLRPHYAEAEAFLQLIAEREHDQARPDMRQRFDVFPGCQNNNSPGSFYPAEKTGAARG
jgi:hypothetical protein